RLAPPRPPPPTPLLAGARIARRMPLLAPRHAVALGLQRAKQRSASTAFRERELYRWGPAYPSGEPGPGVPRTGALEGGLDGPSTGGDIGRPPPDHFQAEIAEPILAGLLAEQGLAGALDAVQIGDGVLGPPVGL